MKHDFCLAGLLTYLCLLCLPTFIYRQWLENEVNSIYTDEAHSNGTVQDFHLIPFSSVLSLAEISEQDFAKLGKVFGYAIASLKKVVDTIYIGIRKCIRLRNGCFVCTLIIPIAVREFSDHFFCNFVRIMLAYLKLVSIFALDFGARLLYSWGDE